MTQEPKQAETCSPNKPCAPCILHRPWMFLLLMGLMVGGLVLAQKVRRGDPSQDLVAWRGSFEQAVDEAKQADKPLFVVFSAEWCGPCNQMKAWVFSDTAISEYIEDDFVPVRIDLTHNEAAAVDLAQRYDVSGIPALLVLNADGIAVSQSAGYKSKDELMDWLTSAKQRLGASSPVVASGSM